MKYALFLIALLFFAGCSTTEKAIEQNSQYKVYENKDLHIRIVVPLDWLITEKNAYKGEINFIAPPDNSSDLLQVIGITVANLSENPITLAQATNLSISQLEKGVPDFYILESRNTTLANMPAYEIVATGTMESHDIMYKLKLLYIWTIKDNIDYAFIYMSDIQNYDKSFSSVNEMIKSFEIV